LWIIIYFSVGLSRREKLKISIIHSKNSIRRRRRRLCQADFCPDFLFLGGVLRFSHFFVLRLSTVKIGLRFTPQICYTKSEEEKRMAFVEFKDVSKIYKTGSVECRAVFGASFFIEKGELAVIAGQSGAGKTTLLNLLGGMDTASGGQIFLDGAEISKYNKRELTAYRRNDIGFIFQFYNLVQNLTALENVELAAQICKKPLGAKAVLTSVGLGDRIDNFPAQLSGGEQQRVAIARAIAKNPKLLLCDEPTGALDYKTGKLILKLLQTECKENGRTVIIITHNQAFCAIANRVIRIDSGEIISVTANTSPMDADEVEW